LKEAGFVEGQNVVVEYRWADGQYDPVQAKALELVGPLGGGDCSSISCVSA
jgi:hypothetical protein